MWFGGVDMNCEDELHRSLSTSLESIIDTINRLNNALYNVALYRERKPQEYDDGLSYKDMKKLKITKEKIYSHFIVPRTNAIPDTRRAHISIECCICQPIREHRMNIWYMDFDIPPQNNMEVAL